MRNHDWPDRRRCVAFGAAFLVMCILQASSALSNALRAEAPSEDLGAMLFNDNDDNAQVEGRAALSLAPAVTPELPAARALLQPLRQLAGAGQGEPTPDDWLRLVKEHMRQAQNTLAAQDATGRASSLQREAVSELDAMLVKLQKQCQKCMGQCNSPSSKPNQSPKPDKSGAKPGATTAQAGAPPAPVDRAAMARLLKDRWGRLPERQRDELLQPLSEDFVPEYAAETEAYFRALAEPRDSEDEP